MIDELTVGPANLQSIVRAAPWSVERAFEEAVPRGAWLEHPEHRSPLVASSTTTCARAGQQGVRSKRLPRPSSACGCRAPRKRVVVRGVADAFDLGFQEACVDSGSVLEVQPQRDQALNVSERQRWAQRASVSICQICFAYSRIVRSAENAPIPATFAMARSAHCAGVDGRASSTRSFGSRHTPRSRRAADSGHRPRASESTNPR